MSISKVPAILMTRVLTYFYFGALSSWLQQASFLAGIWKGCPPQANGLSVQQALYKEDETKNVQADDTASKTFFLSLQN